MLTGLVSAGRAQVPYSDPDGRLLPFSSEEQVLDFLRTADVVWKEKMGSGTNKSKRKLMLEKNGVRAHAIHRTGYEIKEVPGGDFVDSYLSDIAAYEMAILLGLENVPPVVRRKGGSLQIWIENATTDAIRRQKGEEPEDPERFERQLQNMRIFDNLIANSDRNPGNIVIGADGKVWFVDHGRSFAGQEELKYPELITGCDRALWQRLREVSDDEIREAVGPYVRTYMRELLLRRQLLVKEIQRRIDVEGEDEFLFTGSRP
jgi:hypothetical protein